MVVIVIGVPGIGLFVVVGVGANEDVMGAALVVVAVVAERSVIEVVVEDGIIITGIGEEDWPGDVTSTGSAWSLWLRLPFVLLLSWFLLG